VDDARRGSGSLVGSRVGSLNVDGVDQIHLSSIIT
jgi:hypothetical protein